MSIKNLQPRFFVLLLFIIVAGVLRITAAGHITPFSNFSPVGAMALFGGAYFADKWKSYVFPLLCIFLSDVIMNLTIYDAYVNGIMYDEWIWTYLGFAAMVLTGQLLIKRIRITNIVVASVVSAVAFWLLSDFGTWLSPVNIDMTTGTQFTKDFTGLVKCYIQGASTIKNTLMSNLVYSAIFFGLFELMQNKIPALAISK